MSFPSTRLLSCIDNCLVDVSGEIICFAAQLHSPNSKIQKNPKTKNYSVLVMQLLTNLLLYTRCEYEHMHLCAHIKSMAA